MLVAKKHASNHITFLEVYPDRRRDAIHISSFSCIIYKQSGKARYWTSLTQNVKEENCILFYKNLIMQLHRLQVP